VTRAGRAEDGDPGSHHERAGADAGRTAARPTPASPRPAGRADPGRRWYLADKRSKRIWSRGLRLLVILLVTAGGLQPLLDAAAPGPSRTAWGYVLLALAAACIGLDRFFGISSGWMRSMTTAQALERRLEQLQYDWAAECARSAARTVDPKQAQTRLALLRAVSDDMAALMQRETAEWVLEFQSNLLRLETSTGGSWSSTRGRPVPGREGEGRAPPPVRGRPPSRPRRRVARMVGAPTTPRGDPRKMPTDHGPELEALAKRLADAKEFL
jgi:SMODS and SLOG-associating 2TM effector domain 2